VHVAFAVNAVFDGHMCIVYTIASEPPSQRFSSPHNATVDILIFAIVISLAGLASSVWSRQLSAQDQQLRDFSAGEVQAGPYIIYEGKVYDVSTFRHPGGSRRLQEWVGRDATDVLNNEHSSRDRRRLEDLLVGVLV
jgi:predicted heme/steroid binding protein